MNATYTQTTGTYRIYTGESNYINRDEYDGIASIMWLSPTEVYLYGALTHTSHGFSFLIYILNDLINRDVIFVRLSRASKRKMPFGKMIADHGSEKEWEIDLSDSETIKKVNKFYAKLQMS
jgi:hypothetical protein